MRSSFLKWILVRASLLSRNPRRRTSSNYSLVNALENRTLLSAPTGSPWASFGHSPSPSVIITFGTKGAVSIVNTGVGPYDNIEDTYIGVINNSGKPISSFKVSAPASSDIFGFDGDGIQTYGSPAPPIGSLNGYEGPDNFFSNISGNGASTTGTVNFIGGLPTGRQTYFSLEGVPQRVVVGVDLQLTINDPQISPSDATDQHLNQFFGGESVRIPVEIHNIGAEPTSGKTTLEVYVSTTSDLTGVVAGPFRKDVNVSLAASGVQSAFVDVTINAPLKLKAGDSYYFVTKLTSLTIKESDVDNGKDENNLAASASQYEYMGSPSKPLLFTTGKYYKVTRDTLKSADPFLNQGASFPTSGQQFTAAFESRGGYDNPNLAPYLDPKNIPTIGIGINLTTLSAATRNSLAIAVKAFYRSQAANHAAGYSNIDSKTSQQVVAMLVTQAYVAGHRRQAQDAFTSADAQAIFDAEYNSHMAKAAATVGQVIWNNLPENVRWVLTDIDFNVGSLNGFQKLLSDIRATGGPNLIRAGFDFFDSKRTLDVQYDRTLAGFQFLVQGHTSELGSLI